MFYTYIIQSEKTKKYYVGYSSNINQRLKKHNNGSNKSTKYGIPWKLMYKEEFSKKEDAWKREQQIKRYKGGNAFKMLIGEVA
ncbi:MAG: GIY-YIG nuclease family protein [bacterium]